MTDGVQLSGVGVSLVPAAASSVTIGTTTITGGTTTRVLYDNGGVVGEYAISGTGNVAMTTSPAFTTPALGVAAATSVAVGGATIGANAIAWTGTANGSGAFTLGGALTYGGVTLSNAVTGTGNMVLGTSPSLTTPALGVATATSLALGGATIGTDALAVTGTTTHNGALVVNAASFSLSGNQSAAAWTTTGIRYKNVAATFTDTTSSGTVAAAYTNVFGGSTVAASSATTYTQYVSTYFSNPIAGTNVTMTNKSAMGADSISIGGAAQGANALAVTGSTALAATTISAALTYGGVTLSNAVTGTGNMVLSSTPTLTTPVLGDATATSVTASGLLQAGTTLGISTDVLLNRDAAAQLALRNSTTAQSFFVYNTFTSSTNYERGAFDWTTTANTLTIGTQKGSSGTARALRVVAGGSTVVDFLTNANASFAAQVQSTSGGGGFVSGSTGRYYFSGSSSIKSQSDGVITLFNSADADWGRLQFGGTTSSFPSLKRSSATLAVRLADDSADAAITTAGITASGITSVTNTTDATTTTTGALQVAGGAAIRKRVFIDGITSSAGLQTAVLCQSSAGEMIADSVACLASSERFKTLLGSAEKGALDKVLRIPVRRWQYRREADSVFPDNYYNEHIGPTAEDIEAIDPRLVGRDQQGLARSIGTDQLLALAIQAMQEQQEQIDEIRARLAA